MVCYQLITTKFCTARKWKPWYTTMQQIGSWVEAGGCREGIKFVINLNMLQVTSRSKTACYVVVGIVQLFAIIGMSLNVPCFSNLLAHGEGTKSKNNASCIKNRFPEYESDVLPTKPLNWDVEIWPTWDVAAYKQMRLLLGYEINYDPICQR